MHQTQGSVFEAVLLTIYLFSSGDIIKYCATCSSANSGITKPEVLLNLSLKIINIWMMSSFLLLNSDKTEV